MSKVYHTKLSSARRIAIPAELCRAWGILPGDPVTLEFNEDGLRLLSLEQTIRSVQERLAPYRIEGQNLVDELIAERRTEAIREANE